MTHTFEYALGFRLWRLLTCKVTRKESLEERDPSELGRVSSEDTKRVCSCETRLQREHISTVP